MEQTNRNLIGNVGANLKRAIKESKWKTQEKFSEAFGAEVRTVGRWCNQGIDKLSLVQQILYHISRIFSIAFLCLVLRKF